MSEQLREHEASKPVSPVGVVGNRLLKTSIQKAKHLYDQYRFSGLMAKTEMLLDLTHKIRSDDGVIGFNIPHHNGRVTVSRHIYNTPLPL